MDKMSISPVKSKPMGWISSLLYFGISAIALYVAIHSLTPILNNHGMSIYMASWLSGLPVVIALFFTAFIAYKTEGNPFTWSGIKERFRLNKMTGHQWLWTIGLILFCIIGYGIFSQITGIILKTHILPLPDYIPAPLDPRIPKTNDLWSVWLDGYVAGNWPVVMVQFIFLFFNVFGEEFLWRGYILP
jgi:membrane protease YdiL (CAAX protease family)